MSKALTEIATLLETAASINRDYLRTLSPERRDNPTENYIQRFQSAADQLRRYDAKSLTAAADSDGRTDVNCVYCGEYIGTGLCRSSACIDGRA